MVLRTTIDKGNVLGMALVQNELGVEQAEKLDVEEVQVLFWYLFQVLNLDCLDPHLFVLHLNENQAQLSIFLFYH